MKKIINISLFLSIASAFALGQVQGNGAGVRQKTRPARLENPTAASTLAARIFSDDLPLLKDGTRVPILLPGELLSSVADNRIKVTSATSDKSGYEIALATGEDCGDACFVGTFSATPDDGHATGSGEDGSHVVRLARGIKGSYTPRTCGGSCTPPSISWLYGKHAYYIQFNVRGGTPAQQESNLIRMANSAIEGGPR